ncbi:MAG: DUF362 domain-containing protein [Vulcanimicrobiota bacterium]
MISKVYFYKTGDNPEITDQEEAIQHICKEAGVAEKISKDEYVAVKLHVGDVNNTTHVRPGVVKSVVDEIRKKEAQVFLTETSTLYRGARENAVKHIMHAVEHGFSLQETGAPFIMADGLAGDSEIEVKINGEMFDSVLVAREARMADFLMIVSHMTGHIATGFGAAIKNLGMGLASRKGKLRQHSSIKPEIIYEKCVYCRKCEEWCPKDAISENEGKAWIDPDKCIGCGECLAVCRFGAVKFDWGAESDWMQKAMAEHALGVVVDKKAFYFNVCVNMTKDCDCFTIDQKKMIPDIGILGSWDPVALDQASLDLTKNSGEKNLNQMAAENVNGNVQLEHAEKIGLGTRNYEIVQVN